MPSTAVRKTIGGLAATGLIFALVVGTDAFLAYRLNDLKQWTLHTHKVIEELQTAQLALCELEGEDRGYAISGNKNFLLHYEDDKKLVIRSLDNAREMLSDNAEQLQLLQKARASASEKIEFAQQVIDTPDHTAALALIDSLRGQQMMETFRQNVNAMTAKEEALLEERATALEGVQKASWALNVVLGIFTIFLLRWIFGVSQAAVAEEHKRVQELEAEIVERKRAERRLLRTTQKLQSSNTDLQQFAYVASHDLQEPLRAVGGFLTLIVSKNKGQVDAETEAWINQAVEGAQRMRTLINDLLSYARVESQGKEFEDVDCEAALQRARKDLGALLEESGARVESGYLPHVMGDEGQLAQVFQNLIGNAVKYRSADPPLINIQAIENKKDWEFSVKDNGIGFDEEHAKRIFVIFQRLHSREDYEGTGIGLSLCKKIIERHGGRIWAHSQPGQGATFYFTLPMHLGSDITGELIAQSTIQKSAPQDSAH